MDDDVRNAINSVLIEIDRLQGRVAAVMAYLAATVDVPANIDDVKAAARRASLPPVASGGAPPSDHAEDAVVKIAELSQRLRTRSAD